MVTVAVRISLALDMSSQITRDPHTSAKFQHQGLFGTLFLVIGVMYYMVLQQAAAYALRDGHPMSVWAIYLLPALFLLGAVYHYTVAIIISRGASVPFLFRVTPISVAGAFFLDGMF